MKHFARQTKKAVAYTAKQINYERPQVGDQLVWIPKSLLDKDGNPPQRLVSKKLDQLNEQFDGRFILAGDWEDGRVEVEDEAEDSLEDTLLARGVKKARKVATFLNKKPNIKALIYYQSNAEALRAIAKIQCGDDVDKLVEFKEEVRRLLDIKIS